MKKRSVLFFLLASGISSMASANDFPTIERVKYVQECMALNGGASYINIYGCSCMIDHIAEKMTHTEFEHADAFKRLRNMRGERGGYFRSSDDSRNARKDLRAVEQEAKKRCLVTTVSAPKDNKKSVK